MTTIDDSVPLASMIFPAILEELDTDVIALNAFINSAKITKLSKEFHNSLN
jgi:hypothetical protein